ncbi:MAG: VCBS repeat-containing protein [Planctomycetes bacterium]|nr:VCBS repeat-containing protein [Planctomycetota bacterium]MCH9726054.1 VCBS repeat-containing protein [Planctomycetota bacterium]MCH9777206.1 VCBS repeat-containing protein [Planctomycetota bacterium]MCH9790045.1 VCBS repeat-containing protein [Planctomycetota bacterium]
MVTQHLFRIVFPLFTLSLMFSEIGSISAEELEQLTYHNPKLEVDLGVGLWAWPLPVDYDNDGDLDLLVSCPDKPSNGTYFFENRSDGKEKMPVFEPGVRLGKGYHNTCLSYVDGTPRVLVSGREVVDFKKNGFDKLVSLPVERNVHGTKVRGNQWYYLDYDGDKDHDLIVGVGDWGDYGWDDAYNEQGQWTNGPLRGFVYVLKNSGTDKKPKYSKPTKIQIGDQPLEVFGWPCPNFADFDHDGDLDLICGEFLDQLTYFENTGTRAVPRYVAGRRLSSNGRSLQMDLQMIVPSAIDWDQDGDTDFVIGDEDGRVAFMENTGELIGGLPQFLPPRYFRQKAAGVKFGALVTPYAYDWDGDGDEDLICGNTAGYIGLIENLDGHARSPRLAAPRYLKAGGHPIRIQAGPNGSIQGPCEAKWGYTTQTVADWNQDGLPDLLVNSIWGEILWYQNIGTRQEPKLASAQTVSVEWEGAVPKPAWNWWNPRGNQLVTQWRTTPVAIDYNQDGLTDLVMLDHEGYLAFFERISVGNEFKLLPGKRIFVDETLKPIRMNSKRAGGSGRYKLHVVDWDGDGRLDLLVNSRNADFYRNEKTVDGKIVLKNQGPISKRTLGGHTSSPCTVDWDQDGIRDLIIGAEDGYLYWMKNPRSQKK